MSEKHETITVMIEIPKGSRNKYEYDEEKQTIKIWKKKRPELKVGKIVNRQSRSSERLNRGTKNVDIKEHKVWKELGGWLCKWPLICYWLPPLAWMLLIFAVSAQPTLPQAPDRLVDALLKKGAHILEYAVLMVLFWRAWASRPRPIAPLALAFVLTMLYAASDEFHQTFVLGRHGRTQDVVIDGLGAALATLGVWATMRWQKGTEN